MQLAVVEFGRNVCGLADANSTEINAATPHPMVALMAATLSEGAPVLGPAQENEGCRLKYWAS